MPYPRADSPDLEPSRTKLLLESHGQLIDATSHKAGISKATIVFTRTIVLLTPFAPNRSTKEILVYIVGDDARSRRPPCFKHFPSDFEFVSDFEFRISDLPRPRPHSAAYLRHGGFAPVYAMQYESKVKATLHAHSSEKVQPMANAD